MNSDDEQPYRYICESGRVYFHAIPPKFAHLGKLGENIVEEALNKLEKKYIRTKTNGIGPDFWVDDTALIEVKNWQVIMSQFKYFNETRARFTDTDPDHKKIWILVTSAELGEFTKEEMEDDGVHLIKIPSQITDDTSMEQRKEALRIITEGLRQIIP